MILKRGNMFEHTLKWPEDPSTVFFTANASVTEQGRLVMGRGAARCARDRFSGLDYALGKMLSAAGWAQPADKKCIPFPSNPYGVLTVVMFSNALTWGPQGERTIPGTEVRCAVGAFQVKDCWWEDAQLDLIQFSTRKLIEEIIKRPGPYHLNFPGCGNGRLRREDVLPIITYLPDCVTVWEI